MFSLVSFAPRLALAPLALLSLAVAAPTSTSTFPAPSTPTLRINEVLASNTRIANATTFPDIIELHNAGPVAIDLAGKSLNDVSSPPRKFTFPAGTTIAAGGYLVVYADADSSAPGIHTGFALDAEGDALELRDTAAAGGGIIDTITFGFQVPDYSISRTGPGADVWTLTSPTPGAANAAPSALAAPEALRINEWAGKISFRLDHDLIELFNTAATQPVALGGVRLTDDSARPTRFVFPALSFIGPRGFLALFGADFKFGLDGDTDPIFLLGENNESIDRVSLDAQPRDFSTGRNPDGSTTLTNYAVPTPGMSNTTPLPVGYQSLLTNLRITEVMFQPAASSDAGDYEYIELQNIGSTTLDLGGVRFTNGLDYTFPAGTTLAGGAFIVVAKNRNAFLSRYPTAASVLAPNAFAGALDNTGETLALTLPAPWYVHILRFRYEPTWYASTAGGGFSLVVPAAATISASAWADKPTWRASAGVNGSPGAVDAGSPDAPASRLSNLSVRTALAGGQTLIVGTTVSGGASNLLVRAAGPALAALGVSGAMTDPRLELYSGATRVFENNDWPASLATTFASVAAFPFPAGSRDAAFERSIEGGPTIQVNGTAAGVVLVEVYDLGTGSPARLTNVSARNQVGTGDNILIAGFNISGTASKQLLIRGIGPKLSTFGVTNFLADPKLEIYTAATPPVKVAENDNWAPTLGPIFASVAAFALDPNSRDAALVATLPPGSYTVQVSGVGNTTGEALIEIYELP